ncbi:MAG: hypothetical protein E1N59_1862 [Puniceicoccaceae bacterium 5H]|nr:MAG: hypothetical protein E1N59_1862 [Puniceicoccaceae bacterium 5H]
MTLLLAQLHDLRPPIRFSEIPWLTLALIVAALLLILGLSLFWRNRSRTRREAEAARLTPIQVARRELKTLMQEHELTDRAFAYELTRIVRGYAEGAFRLPATDRTTEEVLEALQARPPFSSGLADRLGQLLQNTVLVRYAAQPLSPEEREALLREGEQWVEQAEQERQQQTTAPSAA